MLNDEQRKGFEDLKQRAEKRKNDPNLRHEPTPEEIAIYNQNTKDVEIAQYMAMEAFDKNLRKIARVNAVKK